MLCPEPDLGRPVARSSLYVLVTGDPTSLSDPQTPRTHIRNLHRIVARKQSFSARKFRPYYRDFCRPYFLDFGFCPHLWDGLREIL